MLGLKENKADRQQTQGRQEGGLPAEETAADGENQDGRGESEDDWREEAHGSDLVGAEMMGSGKTRQNPAGFLWYFQ